MEEQIEKMKQYLKLKKINGEDKSGEMIEEIYESFLEKNQKDEEGDILDD